MKTSTLALLGLGTVGAVWWLKKNKPAMFAGAFFGRSIDDGSGIMSSHPNALGDIVDNLLGVGPGADDGTYGKTLEGE